MALAGGPGSADLLAARDAATALEAVARVTQPYRVRGGRAPGSAARQDAAWLEIAGVLRDMFPGIPLVQGGRSNGARLACRTAVRQARGRGRACLPVASAGPSGAFPVAELRAAASQYSW